MKMNKWVITIHPMTRSMTKIEGSRILITGAASGFGRLMALRIARMGGELVLWDIDEKGLETVVKEINGGGGKAHSMLCNLRERGEIESCAIEVLKEGAIDILINNAGIVSGQSLLQLKPEQIEATFDVNSLALFWTTRAFLPMMIEQNRGHIVTIASAGGLVGTSQLVDYCASKFAAVGFDESLRAELRQMKSKVRTTVVCPFFANTGMFEGVRSRFFLLPVLKPQKVANKAVKAISKNRRRVIMPLFVYTSLPCRMLPVWMFDKIMDILGLNKAMSHFSGREKEN